MAGGSKEFWVKSDELKAVADAIADLLDQVDGSTGVRGSQKDFQKNAGSTELIAGLANLDGGGGGSGAFGGAYGEIFDATNLTYAQMVTNLQNLETACRTTAEQYQNQEDATQQQINQTNPGGEE